MDSLSILQQAIEERRSIEFEYNKSDKVPGKRIGDPHAVFIHQSTNNATVDIFQTGGVSDTSRDFPFWRPFLLEHLDAVKILDKHFDIAEGYDSNPVSGKYKKVICKVE